MKAAGWIAGGCVLGVLLLLELVVGTVHIPLSDVWSILTGEVAERESWATIIFDSRIPRALAALAGGGGLAISGLLMQTYFRNALAGPSVLGLSSGASLGVALVVLVAGGSVSIHSLTGIGSALTVALAAMIGAGSILILIMAVARRFHNATSLLIFGLMIGYITSAVVAALQFGASKESLQIFVLWGLGSFADVHGWALYVLLFTVTAGLILTLLILKHLNPLLMGEQTAQSMGVPVRKVSTLMLLITGILAGSVTAFCGPIAFLGLAVPHLARGLVSSANHGILLPATVLLGGGLGLICDLLTRVPFFGHALPLNAITCLVGAPVVIWIVLRNQRMGQML
jgi:iron complex transport system permease protein